MQPLELGKINTQSGVPGLNRNDAYKVKIPLPPLKIQKQLVEEAEKEEEIITANQKLIKLMESKINDVISDLW
jgi:restriction endonuclease S subunit